MIEAAKYYESQAPGLGVAYLSEVEQNVAAIAESPMMWPIVEDELRRHLVRKFPFGIIYRIEPENIVIIAVAHLRRRPGYWRKRTKRE